MLSQIRVTRQPARFAEVGAYCVPYRPSLHACCAQQALVSARAAGGGSQDSCARASARCSIDSDSDLRARGPGPAGFGLRSSLGGHSFKVKVWRQAAAPVRRGP